jgi:hypothetical protein
MVFCEQDVRKGRLLLEPLPERLEIGSVAFQRLPPDDEPSVFVLNFDIKQPDQAACGEVVGREDGPSQGDPLGPALAA